MSDMVGYTFTAHGYIMTVIAIATHEECAFCYNSAVCALAICRDHTRVNTHYLCLFDLKQILKGYPENKIE